MRRVLSIAAAALLAGCGLLADNGTTYPIAAKEARATLLLTEPPMFLFGSTAANARVSRDGDGTVRWLIVDKLGTGMLTLVAHTEEVDPQQTRVIVSLEPPPGGKHDEVKQRLADNSAIVEFYKAAMEEQIAAKFQNREFDMAAIQGEMIAAAIANVPNMTADLDKAAAESNKRNRGNIEQAYREEAQGSGWSDSSEGSYGSGEPAYGEPMDGSGSSY